LHKSCADPEYGGLNAAAEPLGFPSVRALQKAIEEYCAG